MVTDPETVPALTEPTTLAALLSAAQLPASADAETLGAAVVLASGSPTTESWEWWELTLPTADAPARYRVQAGRIERADGSFQFVTTSDPGRLLLTGQPADLFVMDVTQLRGIANTAPYFQNNSADTLEDVLDHYDALFRRVARLNPPPNLPPLLSSNGLVVDRGFVTAAERPALLAYLRKF